MEITDAIRAFASLAQETRLAVFRLLVIHEPSGLPAGAIAEALAVPANTLSFHLHHLSQAGLVTQRKDGRSVIYRADIGTATALASYLVNDCCAATGAACDPPTEPKKDRAC